MARRRTGSGRVARPDDLSGPAGSAGTTEIAPLYKRRPAVFAFIMLACAAMVLSMMAGIFTAL